MDRIPDAGPSGAGDLGFIGRCVPHTSSINCWKDARSNSTKAESEAETQFGNHDVDKKISVLRLILQLFFPSNLNPQKVIV